MRAANPLFRSLLFLGLLFTAKSVLAVPVEIVYQSDVQLGNDTFLLRYDSLNDFSNANASSTDLTAHNFATGGYLAGFTSDDNQYHLIYQSDAQFGNETFLISYDSLNDFNNANLSSSLLTANNFATGGYLAGFTYDGSQYHLIYQSDVALGNETFLVSYSSLADFISANAASVALTLNNFATGGYLAGFTYDGSQYHLVYQSDVALGNETFMLSYNSIADFITANTAAVDLTLNNFATGGYLAGFNAYPAASEVPEPSTLVFSLGLLIGSLRRIKKKRV